MSPSSLLHLKFLYFQRIGSICKLSSLHTIPHISQWVWYSYYPMHLMVSFKLYVDRDNNITLFLFHHKKIRRPNTLWGSKSDVLQKITCFEIFTCESKGFFLATHAPYLLSVRDFLAVPCDTSTPQSFFSSRVNALAQA